MANSPKRFNPFLIGTMLFVIMLMLYYIFAHIPSKELEIQNRGIRVVERMSRNIQDRQSHYQKSIDNFECEYLLNNLFRNSEDIDIGFTLFSESCMSAFPDSIRDKNENILDDFNALWLELYNNTRGASYLSREEEGKLFDRWRDSLYAHYNYEKDLKYIKAESTNKLKTVDPSFKIQLFDSSKVDDFLVYKLILEQGRWSEFLGLTATDFMQEIKQYEFFEDIILVDKNYETVVDSSLMGIEHFAYADGKYLDVDLKDKDGNKVGKAPVEADKLLNGVSISSQKISNVQYLCFTKLITVQGNEYYLTGLIEQSHYEDQARAVSVWVVLITVVFLIFLIQILPITKPFLMGKADRLKGNDMMWSGISLVFGLSALSLFTISINTFNLEEKKLVQDRVKGYADSISTHFIEEQKAAYQLVLDYSNDLFDPNDIKAIARADSFLTGKKNHFSFLEVDGTGELISYSKYFRGEGLTLQNSTPNVKHRKYISIHTSADSLRAWDAPDSIDHKHPMFVESIFSMSTGKYETVLSVKISPNKIIALVYPFSSVNNVYLEPNYQFYIVDHKGQIQFSTETTKIKNDNIIEESDNDKNVIAYLSNGSSSFVDLKLSLKDYTGFIKPIPKTDFYILTTYNISKSRLTISTSLITTFQFTLLILAYLLLFHLLLKAQGMLFNKHNNKSITYYFLSPKNIPRNTYILLTLLNVVLGIFFLIMYKYYYLNLANSASLYFAIVSAGALINYRILTLSQIENPDIEYLIYKYRISMFELVLVGLTLLWTIAFFIIEESNLIFIIMPLLLLAAYAVRVSYDWKKEKSKQNHSEFDFRYFKKLISWVQNSKEKEKNKAHRNYSPFYLHGFTWIILVSLIPTLLFFKPIYNHHHLKRVRHDMQEEYFYRIKTQQWKSNKISSFPLLKEHNAKDTIQENDATKKMIDVISFYLGNDGEKLKGLDKSENLIFDIFKEKEKGSRYFSVYMKPYDKYYDKNTVKPTTVVAFRAPILNADDVRQALFFWSIIIATLVLLYITIVQLSEKFFHLKLLENLKTVAPDKHSGDDVHKSIKGLGSLQKAEKYFMLTGLPFSGKNTVLRKHLGDEAYNDAYHLDLLSSLDEFTKKLDDKQLAKNNVIINNFDHRIHDFEHNKLKLNLLEHILGIRTVKNREKVFALVTNFDIYQIIEVYQEKIDSLKLNADPESKSDIESYSKTMNRWSSALIGFTKHVIPLTSQKIEEPTNEEEENAKGENEKTKEIEKVIDRELNFGEWLPTLKPHMKNFIEAFPNDESLSHADIEDNINNEIRSKSENYYFSMWNSCSKSEKFLLYDLAQDGLINAANVSTITSLTRKGIVTIDPYLKLFNNSFGEFIINSISSEDYKQIEKQKKAGTWSSYRYFVIFLVIVIVIFLSYVEQQAFTEITGLVSLGAALAPRVITMISSITNRKKIA